MKSQFLIFWTAILFLTLPVSTSAQEIYADWLTATGLDATFDLGGVSATVTIQNPMNGSGNVSSISAQDGAVNYPDVWVSPGPPPVGTEWVVGGVGNVDGANPGSVDYVFTFSSLVENPRFHFLNLDAGTVGFGPTTDSNGDPVALTRLSGNPEFEVMGNLVNSTPRIALAFGCEDAGGGNPEGACGTVQLTGTYSSVTFVATDTDVGLAGGDGYAWTVSADGPVEAQVDLSVVKTVADDPVEPGASTTYTVTVTNNSPSITVPDVVVMDTLPSEVTLDATTGCAEDPVGAPLCTLGSIAPLASAVYVLEVTVDPAAPEGVISNSADVTSALTTDPNLGNNASTVETTVAAPVEVPALNTPGLIFLVLSLSLGGLWVLKTRRPRRRF